MRRFYKREWLESRGDQHDAWGTSVWYFEIGDDRRPTRQLEVYQSGVMLAYDTTHRDDEFGALGDQAALNGPEWDEREISADEFESAWRAAQPRLRNR
ncbi:MAG TPA: hypothetical protein VGL86_33055 [Polyangia bacterium]